MTKIPVNKKAILTLVIIPLAIVSVSLTCLYLAGVNNYWIFIPLYLYVLARIVFSALIPLLKTHLFIDDKGIKAVLKKEKIEVDVDWKDVIAARLEEDKRNPGLHIVTNYSSEEIPLRNFDRQLVWSLVREKVPPEALEPDAFEKLPEVQKWKAEVQELVKMTDAVRQSDSKAIRLIGWILVITFGIVSGIPFFYGQGWASLFFIPFVLLGIFMLKSYGFTIFDSSSITRKDGFGQFRIGWDEINLIEMSPLGDGLLFKGINQRLSIPGPIWWEGEDGMRFKKILSAQIEYRDIPTKENRWAAYTNSKNCRLKEEI